jgi:peroxiredoxin
MIASILFAAIWAPQQASAALAKAEIGQPAPLFSLLSTTGKAVNLEDYKGKFVVLEWTNHGCPIVGRHYRSGNMQAQQKEAKEMGAVWLSIVSSKEGSQGYITPEQGEAIIKEKGHVITAMLLDPKGQVGHTYGAKTTPHMYVINPDGKLIYNGGIDDDPGGRNVSGARKHVIEALKESMAGKEVSVSVSQPYGCAVKY